MKGIEVMRKMEGWDEVNNFKQLTEFLESQSHNDDISINVRTTPWCAAMINATERAAGNPGNGKLNARSFLNYGKHIELKDAKEGDIVVFERGTDGWSGHVAYYINHGKVSIQHLGGNQWSQYRKASDEVNIGFTPITKLLGIRRYE